MDIPARLSRAGIIPVAAIESAENAVPAAEALLAGGIDVMEITLRTAAAIDAIKTAACGHPDMLVGAGTVTTAAQAREAVSAGAKFIVTPGYDRETVEWCLQNGAAVIPGCVTPTEIMAARRQGLRIVKFFPAGLYGGLAALEVLSGPFGDVRFIPTGGVGRDNLAVYAASPLVHAVGGSWLCGRGDIAAGRFEKITRLCAQAREIWGAAR